MLCKLLDRENTGDIEFTEFSKGLKYIRYVNMCNCRVVLLVFK